MILGCDIQKHFASDILRENYDYSLVLNILFFKYFFLQTMIKVITLEIVIIIRLQTRRFNIGIYLNMRSANFLSFYLYIYMYVNEFISEI